MRRNRTGDGDRKSVLGRGKSVAQLSVPGEGLGSPGSPEEQGWLSRCLKGLIGGFRGHSPSAEP